MKFKNAGKGSRGLELIKLVQDHTLSEAQHDMEIMPEALPVGSENLVCQGCSAVGGARVADCSIEAGSPEVVVR